MRLADQMRMLTTIVVIGESKVRSCSVLTFLVACLVNPSFADTAADIKELEAGLARAEQEYGEDSLQLIGYLSDLAVAEEDPYFPDRQIDYYKRALAIVAAKIGADSDEYAKLAWVAGVSIQLGTDSSIGIPFMLEAYESFLSRKGETAQETGLVAYDLSWHLYAQGNYENAVEFALVSLVSFQLEDDPTHQMEALALLVREYEELGESDLATEHCIVIGRLTAQSLDQDRQPLFRMAPRYPSKQLISGEQGYVDLEFDIDEQGFVRDPTVVELMSTPPLYSVSAERMRSFGPENRSFEAAALQALERFRYAPKFVHGQAVRVENVTTRISFELDD
jgi:hypothetical protein